MSNDSDVLSLLVAAGRPVKIVELATALESEPADLIKTVDRLARDGTVTDSGDGIALVDASRIDVSTAHQQVASELWARALVAMDSDPVEAGLAFSRAGDPVNALLLLLPAALDGQRIDATEALLGDPLESHLSATDRGRLYKERATHREMSGNAEGAARDLEIAARHLEGEEFVEALGFAVTVTDDVQKPQAAETLAALAAHAATSIRAPAKEGSLRTLHARQLSRIGFPEEADRVLEVGAALVSEHGTDTQKVWARWNTAWLHLDRGEVREAESLFGFLRDQAVEVDDLDLANKEAYWSRALFGIGHAVEAREAAGRARDLARRLNAQAPIFLAGLGEMEGALWFHRYDEADKHADETLDVVREHLPVWKNVVLIGKARAQAGMGDRKAATETIAAALDATPAGPNGWRLRLQATEVAMSLTPDSDAWPQRAAEDLTDELLRARWFATAARLMTERAKREDDPTLGLEAAGLALQLGNPMLAADAMGTAKGWEDPEAVPVSRAVQAIESHVPDSWKADWNAIPAVSSALSVAVTEDADPDLLQRHIDNALKSAGLVEAEIVYSPAQRTAGGQVRRRPRRERRVLAGVARAAAVVVLAIGSVYALDRLTEASPTVEERQVDRPEDGVVGTSAYRGGPERTGVVGASIRTVKGYYWKEQPGGFFGTPPVAFGRTLYIGSSTNNALYYLSQDSGKPNFSPVLTGGGVRSAPAFDPDKPEHLVFGADDGRVYAVGVSRTSSQLPLPFVFEAPVSGSPLVIGNSAIVVTENGVVRAMSLVDPELSGSEGPGSGEAADTGLEWTYPGTLGNVNTSPASDGTNVYVVDEHRFLHIIEIATGEPACPSPILLSGSLAPGNNPIVTTEHVYFPAGAHLDRMERGKCVLLPSMPALSNELFARSPVIDGTTMYAGEGWSLFKFDVSPDTFGLESVWEFLTPDFDTITTSPTLAGDVLYFGTQSGFVYAVSAEDGTELWRFSTGAAVVGLAPVRDAVFVSNADGLLIAIAGE